MYPSKAHIDNTAQQLNCSSAGQIVINNPLKINMPSFPHYRIPTTENTKF